MYREFVGATEVTLTFLLPRGGVESGVCKKYNRGIALFERHSPNYVKHRN